MKQRITLNDFERYESVTLQHLVYEANDSDLLLSCSIQNKGKSYDTHFTIDFSVLNQLISFFAKKGIDIYEDLTHKLLYSNEHYREFDFQKTIGDHSTINYALQAA